MWLLNTTDYELRSFPSIEAAPDYAALSHRWDPIGEVTFADIRDFKRARRRVGWSKIENACSVAKALLPGYAWIWIDTCCIDKSSSAELSEAINSMFMWYLHCGVCLAYLNDVPAGDDPRSPRSAFRSSQWFTRGWTLQELLAPARTMLFFSQDWTIIDTRDALVQVIQDITAIGCEVLRDTSDDFPRQFNHLLHDTHPDSGGGALDFPTVRFIKSLREYQCRFLPSFWATRLRSHSVAKRMSWAAGRTTTRPEDTAYSLMGIFGISMPIIYGEGSEMAFRRLQLEIIRQSTDQTIFGWGACIDPSVLVTKMDGQATDWSAHPKAVGLLASSPMLFIFSGNLQSTTLRSLTNAVSLMGGVHVSHYYETHRGIHIRLPLRPLFKLPSNPETSQDPTAQLFLGALECIDNDDGRHIGLVLMRCSDEDAGWYQCVNVDFTGMRHNAYGRVGFLDGQPGWELSTIYIKL
ncbi:HET-domain-containing protein [Trametes sanguinea]|nr:HET-domain-containing protein [Trametes sanguinea]